MGSKVYTAQANAGIKRVHKPRDGAGSSGRVTWEQAHWTGKWHRGVPRADGVDCHELERMVRRGKIPALKTGHRRDSRTSGISVSDAWDRWLQEPYTRPVGAVLW